MSRQLSDVAIDDLLGMLSAAERSVGANSVTASILRDEVKRRTTPTPRWLPIGLAAVELGIGRAELTHLADSGRIPIRAGRRILIDVATARHILDALHQAPPTAGGPQA